MQYAVNIGGEETTGKYVGKAMRSLKILLTRQPCMSCSATVRQPTASHQFVTGLLLALMVLITPPLLAEEEAEEEAQAVPVISYYQIKPSLVANLASGGKYIRCDVQLMTNDEGFLEELKRHGPALRHSLLLLLSDQDGKDIKTASGKEKLRKKALSDIGKLMQELSGKNELKALFFTTFFVQ
jgi:flagellar FliL protein